MIMMTRRTPRSVTTVAAVLACTALSACGATTVTPAASPAASSRAAQPGSPRATVTSVSPVASQLTDADLKARLLAAADLPSGYRPYTAPNDFPDSSDKPACMTTLNSLSSPSPPTATVTEATAAFAASQTGPWVQEVLRSYPRQGAAQAFTRTKAILAGCRTFSLAWSAPAQTATESVTAAPSPGLGSQSWSASIAVNSQVPVTERLILVQAGSSLLALQMASGLGLPTVAQVSTIAAAAVARLTQ
jgi:hypothetical protein